MILEPKHKNFAGPLQIKETVKKNVISAAATWEKLKQYCSRPVSSILSGICSRLEEKKSPPRKDS
jgi:hypothetical protein